MDIVLKITKPLYSSYYISYIVIEMTKEIKGKVLSFGKIKDYGHETNWGRDWIHNFKFFLKIDSESLGEVLAMVQCKAEDTKWGLRIPKDEERQRPLIGDKVRITTHRIRENGDGAKWASVTWNQSFEIVEVNQKAREERDAWVAEQKAKRQAGVC